MEFKNKLVVVALSAALLLNSSVFAAEQTPSRASVIARATAATVLAAYAAGTYLYNEGSAAGSAVAGTALVAAAAVAPVSITDAVKASFKWAASKIAAYKTAKAEEALPLVRMNGFMDTPIFKGGVDLTPLTKEVLQHPTVYVVTGLRHGENPVYGIKGRIGGARYFAQQPDGNIYPVNDRDIR